MNAIKSLLYRMADDELILGHRNSEWTGLGPVLEEDIAFSSMAQDKIGHSLALYSILHEMGEPEPDTNAFLRNESKFTCCHLVELPIGEYDFSLVRQFFFDHAEYLRYEALVGSSFEPLAKIARKVKGELKYHVLHADTWVRKLGNATEESKARMQTAINDVFPYALGMFEIGEHEDEIIKNDYFIGETELKERWLKSVKNIVDRAGLVLPNEDSASPVLGGRNGYHTEHLAPLLKEMSEVIASDPNAEW